MAAEMHGGDRHVGQQRQRVGQGVFVGLIGHGDDGPLPGEPARGRRSAAKMAQSHDRHPPAAVVHGSSKPGGRTTNKGVDCPPWRNAL